MFAVIPAFGMGVHAFGHLNAAMPVAGAGLTLAFGRLPNGVFPNPPRRIPQPGP